MTATQRERYAEIEQYIRELPGNELKTALLASSIAMIEALDASVRRANDAAEREGVLEQNAGFRPVTRPPNGSQWEIVLPAVYLQGEFCVPGSDGEPIGVSGVSLMRPAKENLIYTV